MSPQNPRGKAKLLSLWFRPFFMLQWLLLPSRAPVLWPSPHKTGSGAPRSRLWSQLRLPIALSFFSLWSAWQTPTHSSRITSPHKVALTLPSYYAPSSTVPCTDLESPGDTKHTAPAQPGSPPAQGKGWKVGREGGEKKEFIISGACAMPPPPGRPPDGSISLSWPHPGPLLASR